MNVNAGIGMKFQFETIVRKVPPMNCRMGCPEWSGDLIHPTEICKTCVQRPIKSHDVEICEVK